MLNLNLILIGKYILSMRDRVSFLIKRISYIKTILKFILYAFILMLHIAVYCTMKQIIVEQCILFHLMICFSKIST
jgi:hypothetical protein